MNNDFSFVAIDTETTGLHHHFGDRAFMVSTCDHEGNMKVWEWDVNPITRQPIVPANDASNCVRYINSYPQHVFHNAQFDVRMLTTAINYKPDWSIIHDTGSCSHLCNSAVHSLFKGKLKSLAWKYLRIPDDDEKELRGAVSAAKKMMKPHDLGWDLGDDKDYIERNYWLPKAIARELELPDDHPWWEVASRYATKDAMRTAGLFHLFWDKIKPFSRLYERERSLMPVLYRMKSRGIHVFPRKIRQSLEIYTEQASSALADMQRITGFKGFNPDSPQQLVNALFGGEPFKLTPVKQTKCGSYSSDKFVVSELRKQELRKRESEFIESLVRYKDAITASKYLVNYSKAEKNGILYPSINQWGTGTIRVSSSDPNGQNVGKGKELEENEKPRYNLREVFGPPKGRAWVCVDFSQLQLRLFAFVSNERSMLEAFDAGYDAHNFVAMKLTGKPVDQVTKLERRIAKNVNFGFIFGSSPKKIEQTAGMPGLWDTVISLFPNAHAFMKATKSKVFKEKKVHTPSGYPLYIPKRGEEESLAAHAGVNYIVQGFEGDLVKEAMIESDLVCESHTRKTFNPMLIFQVHDELIFDIPDYRNSPYLWRKTRRFIRDIKTAMELPGKRYGVNTPVEVEITFTNWSETKDVSL